MIFASDLDRTLIYSSKFISDEIETVVVEYKDREPLSYMTKDAQQKLVEIRGKWTFVPVTTRTMEQYKRINLFQNDDVPQYAITSNGGNVLINGEPDLVWREKIESTINKEGFGVLKVYDLMASLFEEEWVEKVRIADDVFFYMLVYKDDVNMDLINTWARKLDAMDWELIEHGRKIYCIPKCVNKRDALDYVASRIKATKIVSSGDSRMDLTMQSISDQFIVPRHGELVFSQWIKENERTVITEFEGIKAAESVIQLASETLSK